MSSETSPKYMEWSLEEFDIQPSLWRLIEEFVAEAERPDIKEVIGEDLIDETVELYEEVICLNNCSTVTVTHTCTIVQV